MRMHDQKSRDARIVRVYYSDDEIRITRTVRCPSRTRTKWVYFGLKAMAELLSPAHVLHFRTKWK